MLQNCGINRPSDARDYREKKKKRRSLAWLLARVGRPLTLKEILVAESVSVELKPARNDAYEFLPTALVASLAMSSTIEALVRSYVGLL